MWQPADTCTIAALSHIRSVLYSLNVRAGTGVITLTEARSAAQNMQSSSATYESILPGSNSMRLAGSSLSGITADRAAPQLTSAEAKKVALSDALSQTGPAMLTCVVSIVCASEPLQSNRFWYPPPWARRWSTIHMNMPTAVKVSTSHKLCFCRTAARCSCNGPMGKFALLLPASHV